MTLEEAMWREKALVVSFRKRIESMETTDTTTLERLEHEHWQMEHWLKELKELREEVEELREEKKLYFDKAFNSVDKTKLSDHLKNRLIQTAMNNMETIMPYSKVCEDIVNNRLDTWIEEVNVDDD